MSLVVESDAVLIGVFDARLHRARVLVRNSYAQRVVIFNSAMVLVALAPKSDGTKAALKYGSLALGMVGVPHTKPAELLAKVALRRSPEPRNSDAEWTAMPGVTPDDLAEQFPDRIRAVALNDIRTAVLTRFPPAELEVRFHSSNHGCEMQLWLGVARSQALDEVSRVMSRALGPRFREASAAEGAWRSLRNRLPTRGLVVEL